MIGTIGRTIAVAGIVVAGMASSHAMAQNVHISRLYEQVLDNIEYADANHVLDSFGVFRLTGGETARIELDVPINASIQVMGDCDLDCIDLDLAIYDTNGNLLGEDRLADFYPIVNFPSGRNGRVTLELDLVDCDASYCYTAYSVFIDTAP